MKTIELNGSPAAFHDGGRAWQAGQPWLVFIHGAGMSQVVWQQQARSLAHHGFNVLCPDLPGHGATPDGPFEPTEGIPIIEAYASWVNGLIDKVGAERPVVVGHSMGAAIALTLASEFPQSTSGLILLGSSQKMPVHPNLLRDAEQDIDRASAFITAYGLGKKRQLGGAPSPGTSLAGGTMALIQSCPPVVLHRDFLGCTQWDGEKHAPKINIPVLVLAGEDDHMIPLSASKKLTEALKAGQLSTFPGIGHMLQTEAPREVLKAIREFSSGRITVAS